jgi:hypothetical protein
MRFTKAAGLLATTAVSAGCALGLLAGPANAAAQTFKDHETINATGDVFTCQSGDLTVTGGYITQSIEGSVDGHGVFHMTGTIVPHDVTLSDGTNTYTLSGASWFGSSSSSPDGMPTVATETDHFVIRSADGGVYAKVQLVEHISPNGTMIDFDLGQCEEPQD